MAGTRMGPLADMTAHAHTPSSVSPFRPVIASLTCCGFILHLISVSFGYRLECLDF